MHGRDNTSILGVYISYINHIPADTKLMDFSMLPFSCDFPLFLAKNALLLIGNFFKQFFFNRPNTTSIFEDLSPENDCIWNIVNCSCESASHFI